MGKIKNFKVFYPSDLKLDKQWIEENIKPGDIDKYELLECEIDRVPGKLKLPLKMSRAFYMIDVRLQRIEAKVDLLFAMIKEEEDQSAIKDFLKEIYHEIHHEIKEELSSSPVQPIEKTKYKEREKISKQFKFGETDEERRLTIFEILEEIENRGLSLNVSTLKKMGGKYSTAGSYVYNLFQSWKHCLEEYYKFKGDSSHKDILVARTFKEKENQIYTDMELEIFFLKKGKENELIQILQEDIGHNTGHAFELDERENIPNIGEKKLKIYKIMAEVEGKGIPLNTNEFSKLGGKYSTACGSAYKIFSSWKEAVKAYKEEYKNIKGKS